MAREENRQDASELLFEVGRRLQAVALMMRKHRMVPEQQVCACGRIALRVLPVFGLRCDVACEQWQLAHDSMRQLLAQMTDRSLSGDAGRVVGRASLPDLRAVSGQPANDPTERQVCHTEST